MAQSSQTRHHLGILELADNFHMGSSGDGFNILFDGTNTLNIDPENANDIVRIGETNQADLQVDGATDLVWDASAGSLKNGAGFVPVILDAVREVIAAGNPGALSIAAYGTDVSTDGDDDAFSLADGTIVGQLKEVTLDVDGGGNAVITPANYADGTTATLADAGDFVVFMWNGTNWRTVGGKGVAIA